jgi:predicted transcriptional regulator
MLQMSLLLLDTPQETRIKAQEMVDAVQKQEGEVQRYINSLVAMSEA